jgi:glyoxylase-like metal-dependent hydrolase (beta-lactamase superfamily II)
MAGKPAPIAGTLQDGDVLDLGRGVELRVVHTPGHTMGCCTFAWDHEGIAFSGDSVLGRGSRDGGMPLIFYPDQYRRSLELVQELRPRVLCLGHHYKTLRQTNESLRFGDLVAAFVAESAEIQSIIEAATEAALREAGREAPFEQVARRALRRIEEHMPLVNEPAAGWPNGAIAPISAYWSPMSGQAL